MFKIEENIERIKGTFLLKRLGGFFINYFVLLIFVVFLSTWLYTEVYPYFMGSGTAYGLTIIWVGLMTLFPSIFSVYFYTNGFFMHTVFQFLVIFASYFLLNTATALIFRNDLGSLPFGLIIVDKHGNRALRGRIVLRTFLKYLTVFLCPILLLFPLFNRRNACLHELISGAYKVEKPKPVYPPMYYPPQQQ